VRYFPQCPARIRKESEQTAARHAPTYIESNFELFHLGLVWNGPEWNGMGMDGCSRPFLEWRMETASIPLFKSIPLEIGSA
jgi:hypothetical protein